MICRRDLAVAIEAHDKLLAPGIAGPVTTANQVLTEAVFAALTRGVAMRQDVRDAVGKPVRRVTYRTGEVWEYRISDVARRPAKMAVQFGHDGFLKEISKIQEAVSHGVGKGSR